MVELSGDHHHHLFSDCLQEYSSMDTMCWHNMCATRMKVATESRRRETKAEGRAEGAGDDVTKEV